MIAKSFSEAIVQMMEEIAKQIPDAHKQKKVPCHESPLLVYFLNMLKLIHPHCNLGSTLLTAQSVK